MHPKSKEYKALQAVWDEKLKDAGFEDAEQRDGNLRRWHSFDLPAKLALDTVGIQSEYYRSAGMFLHEHLFENDYEKRIWELHSEGVPIREIAKILDGAKAKTKWKVHTTIQRLSLAMKAKWKT